MTWHDVANFVLLPVGDEGSPPADWSWTYGHVNDLQLKAQLISPTSHCAILRASPMLHALSRLTSQTTGFESGATPHWRRPTVYCATTRASPILTTLSPLTSPQSVQDGLRAVCVGARRILPDDIHRSVAGGRETRTWVDAAAWNAG